MAVQIMLLREKGRRRDTGRERDIRYGVRGPGPSPRMTETMRRAAE